MSRLLLAFACLLGFSACRPPDYASQLFGPPEKRQAGQVVREQDRFTKVSYVMLATMQVPLPGQERELGGWELSGNAMSPWPGGLTQMYIRAFHPMWRWLRCAGVDMLIDGEHERLDFKHQGLIVSSGVREDISVDIPPLLLERLLAARSFELRVCGDEIPLTPINTASIVAWLREVRGTGQ